MQEKEILLNNRKIFYRVIGDGPTVILLHGFGEGGIVWKNQFSAFPQFKLIIPDLPGTGRSEMVEDMSMEGLAEVVKDLTLALSNKDGEGPANTNPLLSQDTTLNKNISKSEVIEKMAFPPASACPAQTASGFAGFSPPRKPEGVVIIGHSMGGYITLAFAEKYPQLLNGIGLFHSTAFADNEEKKEVRKKGIHFIEKNSGFDFLKTSIPNLYSDITKEKKPELINRQIQASHNFSGKVLVSYYYAMIERPDRTAVLKNSKIPVLFILGKWDAAVPLQDGLKLAHLPNLLYIHILESSGHMGMIEEAEKSNIFLSNYLNSIYHLTQ